MTHNKTALLARLNAFRKELDALVDFVISLEEAQPMQPVSTFQPEPDTWLTPRQLSKCLNIDYSTVFKWVREGKLPPANNFRLRLNAGECRTSPHGRRRNAAKCSTRI